MTGSSELQRGAEALERQLSAWRRHLHAHPELSGQERETARYVARELRGMGYVPVENVGGTHGLIADLPAPGGGFVALRADMDALPIAEETGLPYASTRPGVMHACGHDAHTAMLLGAARLLMERRDRLRRGVRLIFQPAEEVFPGGAAPMIAAGCLEGVQSIFGLHISSQLPLGVLGTRVGPFMAGVNDLAISVHGHGGHAAMPEHTVDPVLIAAQIVVALQSVVSRSVAMNEAAVVSVTRIEGGVADNVIPELVKMSGTIRTYDEAVRRRVCERVRTLATGIAQAAGGHAEVRLDAGYPVLINEQRTVEQALAAARGVGFQDRDLRVIDAQGGGEDFAYYCQKAPGAFAFLGAQPAAAESAFPHHHPRFDIDEAALPRGAALLAQFALQSGGVG